MTPEASHWSISASQETPHYCNENLNMNQLQRSDGFKKNTKKCTLVSMTTATLPQHFLLFLNTSCRKYLSELQGFLCSFRNVHTEVRFSWTGVKLEQIDSSNPPQSGWPGLVGSSARTLTFWSESQQKNEAIFRAFVLNVSPLR